MDFKIFEKYLNYIFSINNPLCYILFAILYAGVLSQDYFETGKLKLGNNSVILTCNMILYFVLLHVVYMTTIEGKIKHTIDTYYNNLSSNNELLKNYKLKIKKINNTKSIENTYYMILLMLILLLYINVYFAGNNLSPQFILKMVSFLSLTIISEFILVNGAFNNTLITLCGAILRGLQIEKI